MARFYIFVDMHWANNYKRSFYIICKHFQIFIAYDSEGKKKKKFQVVIQREKLFKVWSTGILFQKFVSSS
jgi:hypothetical protein